MARSDTAMMDRFLAKVVEQPGGCWLWTASLGPSGRPQFNADGMKPAHRWIYTQTVGPIPEGLSLIQVCGNKRCVNPRHLVPRNAKPHAHWETRFFEKVSLPDDAGCMLWTGAVAQEGYGDFRHERKTLRAHRVAYELWVGPIPEDLVLDHLCRNRACVNPTHLEPVTRGENNRRGFGWSGIQAQKTHCVRGHLLSGDNIEIRQGRRFCLLCQRIRNARRYANA